MLPLSFIQPGCKWCVSQCRRKVTEQNYGRPGEQVNLHVRVDALDIIEDGEDFGGSDVDVELAQ